MPDAKTDRDRGSSDDRGLKARFGFSSLKCPPHFESLNSERGRYGIHVRRHFTAAFPEKKSAVEPWIGALSIESRSARRLLRGAACAIELE